MNDHELDQEEILLLEVGAAECARLTQELDNALCEIGRCLDRESINVVILTVVRAWHTGYRYGGASIIAQADKQGIYLMLEDARPNGRDEVGGFIQ